MTQESLEPQDIIHVNKHVECYWCVCKSCACVTTCNVGLTHNWHLHTLTLEFEKSVRKYILGVFLTVQCRIYAFLTALDFEESNYCRIWSQTTNHTELGFLF